MKKAIFSVSVIVLMITSTSAWACKSKKISSVQMTRTPCYGTCPWFTVNITSDGAVIYEGKKFVQNEGVYEAQLSKEDVKPIFELINALDFDTLQPKYDEGVTDLPGLNYVFANKKGDEKKIDIMSGGPHKLIFLSKQIDALIEKAWTENKFVQTAEVIDN